MRQAARCASTTPAGLLVLELALARWPAGKVLAQGGRQQEDIRTLASRGAAFRSELARGLTGRDGSRKEMPETYQKEEQTHRSPEPRGT